MAVLGSNFWDIDVSSDDELRAVSVMLLSMHARVPESVVGPGEPRGGWWGNSYPDVPGVELGSRFWAMRGRPINDRLIEDFRLEVIRCHKPLITYGIAKSLDATAERIGEQMVGGEILITRPDDTNAFAVPWDTVL